MTRSVAPPRVLSVDRPLGFPLGGPYDVRLQTSIILAALDMLRIGVCEPLMRVYTEARSVEDC